jgi:NADH-quinone oxidoreductase subunit E
MALNTKGTCRECSCGAEDVDLSPVLKILDKHIEDRAALISILEEVQNEYGYLPEAALRLVAKETGCSLVDIYGVATFYHSFSLKPRGKFIISVCMGTACHVRGGPAVAEEFERQLGIKAGETTPDMQFTLETVNCLGACALGPIVTVGGHYFSHVNTAKVRQIISKAISGLDKIDVKADKRIIHLEAMCPHCDESLMDPEHPIDEAPSINTLINYDGTRGWVRLSSLYGSYNIESQYATPPGASVDFFCPHCEAKLVTKARCPECGAPMLSMRVKGGGIVQACCQRGCKGHILNLNGDAL